MPKIQISAPREGIARSPFAGFGDVRNLDIYSLPGVARLNNILAKKSGSLITAQPNWSVHNPLVTSQLYNLDASGVVQVSTDSGATWAVLSGNSVSSAHGNGLAIWKDYLFVARDAALDTYGPLSGATFTVTIASPAVFSKTAHGLAANDTIIFSTTIALPTGLTAGTVYYVIAAGLTADAFEVSTSQGGAAVNTSGSQSGTHTYKAWKSTNAFETIDSDVLFHPMIMSKNDGKLYGGAGRFIFSLDEVAGQTFTPGVSGTLTWTQQALDLLSPYRIKSIEELGNNLMAGTWQGTNVYDIRIADIFPWDRSSVSFGQPIVMAEYGVHAMLNAGNFLIILAGIGGTIYRSDGVNAYPIGQLPMDLSGGKYLEFYPGALCLYKNKVFFGVGQGGSTAIPAMGVYSIAQTGKGNILNFEHTISTLNDGTTNPLKPSTLLPVTQDTLLVGWQDANSYGLDLTTNTSYAYSTNYSGYFDTQIFDVGVNENKWKPIKSEIRFGRPLRTGEGIQISYRASLADSFTTIKTLAFADNGVGAIITKTFTIQLPDNVKQTDQIQFRVALLGNSTSPEFKALIIE